MLNLNTASLPRPWPLAPRPLPVPPAPMPRLPCALLSSPANPLRYPSALSWRTCHFSVPCTPPCGSASPPQTARVWPAASSARQAAGSRTPARDAVEGGYSDVPMAMPELQQVFLLYEQEAMHQQAQKCKESSEPSSRSSQQTTLPPACPQPSQTRHPTHLTCARIMPWRHPVMGSTMDSRNTGTVRATATASWRLHLASSARLSPSRPERACSETGCASKPAASTASTRCLGPVASGS